MTTSNWECATWVNWAPKTGIVWMRVTDNPYASGALMVPNKFSEREHVSTRCRAQEQAAEEEAAS